PPIALLLCGAGQDAIPLAQTAALMGWQVLVTDHRAAMLTSERFPGAAALLTTPPECLHEHILLDERTAAVVMTHNTSHDLAWLQQLLPSPLPYIGLLGPRK